MQTMKVKQSIRRIPASELAGLQGTARIAPLAQSHGRKTDGRRDQAPAHRRRRMGHAEGVSWIQILYPRLS